MEVKFTNGNKSIFLDDLTGAKLQYADFTRADLEEQSLAGADLSDAYFNFAHLWRANLKEANLRFANFSHAYCPRADFSYADLNTVDFSGANLKYAKLINACAKTCDFTRADLQCADLSGADLSNAIFDYACLLSVDFQNAKIKGDTILGLIARAVRTSDDYEFFAFRLQDGSVKIKAGCRWMTIPEYHEHIAEEYPTRDKAIETRAILDYLEQRASVVKALNYGG